MKLFHKILLTTIISITAMLAQSCKDYDDDIANLQSPTTATAVVTVVPDDNGGFVMKLTGTHTLVPTNMATSPFGNKEVRAIATIKHTSENKTEDEMTFQKVTLLEIDSIQTKNTVPNLLTDNNAQYGNDPVHIIDDWMTNAEDGYLTLHLTALTSGSVTSRHEFYLIRDINPDNPLEFELRHKANGDLIGQQYGQAVIAFNLNDIVEGNSDNRATIKINWLSPTGPRTAEMYLSLRPLKQID